MTTKQLLEAFHWRRRRQTRLARALRKRRELVVLADRTDTIRPGAVLLFCTLRNEALRLPHFLDHYRALGVTHFLIVDNNSTDGSSAFVADQPDVSLWHTTASYRKSRFGMDWLQGLLMKYGHGHWCVTVDVDELLIYPHHDTRPLPALTHWLDGEGQAMFGTLMLDLYAKGPIDGVRYTPGQNPTEVLNWYDAGNYTITPKADLSSLWIQGGPRSRAFFSETPERGPTLTKVPLVKWNWRYLYLNSTHTLLPRHLNRIYDTQGGEKLSGILLHTKFLPEITAKSREEKQRRQHFGDPAAFDAYYDAVIEAPDLWTPYSTPYRGWQQLEAEGLMSRGGWG